MNWPIIQPCKYIPPTPSMHLSHILSRISHHSKCSKNTNFAPPPHPPHPWMKPCWFCYKLTFLRCQLPVGSNVALRWCILRKSCTGRKEKNWIWKRKAQICPLVDHAGRLSRFSTEERARFQFLIANLLLQWTTLSNPWWTQPLEMINFFSWCTHFGLFKVHLQIVLKALQSFFIKELGTFCQICESPIPLFV